MKLKDLINEYESSSDFRSLRYQTKLVYRKALNLMAQLGETEVAELRRRDILQVRDGFSSRPGKANIFLAVTSTLMRFAIEREYRDNNPCREIRPLKLGEWKRWPDAVIEKFLASGAHPMLKLAVLLAIYTGQRQADLLDLTWAQYIRQKPVGGGYLTFRQSKTGQPLMIPVHHRLERALTQDYQPATGTEPDWILHNQKGQKWIGNSFRIMFWRAMKAADIHGYTFHGLRKSAAARLAEAGCSASEIQAITGHRSLAMVGHYTREASQVIQAENAIQKLG